MQISFLLGAGFSKPAAFPLARDLSRNIQDVTAERLYVHTDETAFLLPDARRNDSWVAVAERRFFERLLAFYSAELLPAGEPFDYERYFDAVEDLRQGKSEVQRDFQAFYEAFARESKTSLSAGTMLLRCQSILRQLIGQQLARRFEQVGLPRGEPSAYAPFLSLLEALCDRGVVHVHTLNHDTLFESFAHTDYVKSGISDGFEEPGSPFFGRLHNERGTHSVRLTRFTGRYEGPLRLYKLHGSVGYVWFRSFAGSADALVKQPLGVDEHEFFEEVTGVDGHRYEEGVGDVESEFLSGTTTKRIRYGRGSYYPLVFQRFTENLAASDMLVVVGYGFRDEGINAYLATYVDRDRPFIVVDPFELDHPLAQPPCAERIVASVSDLDPAAVLDHLLA